MHNEKKRERGGAWHDHIINIQAFILVVLLNLAQLVQFNYWHCFFCWKHESCFWSSLIGIKMLEDGKSHRWSVLEREVQYVRPAYPAPLQIRPGEPIAKSFLLHFRGHFGGQKDCASLCDIGISNSHIYIQRSYMLTSVTWLLQCGWNLNFNMHGRVTLLPLSLFSHYALLTDCTCFQTKLTVIKNLLIANRYNLDS